MSGTLVHVKIYEYQYVPYVPPPVASRVYIYFFTFHPLFFILFLPALVGRSYVHSADAPGTLAQQQYETPAAAAAAAAVVAATSFTLFVDII